MPRAPKPPSHDPTKSAQPVADQLLRAKLSELGKKGGLRTATSPARKGFTPESAKEASRRRWDGHAGLAQAREGLKKAIQRVIQRKHRNAP